MSSVWYRLSLTSSPLHFPACLLHSSLSSPAVSGQRYHCMTWQNCNSVTTRKHQAFPWMTPKDVTLKVDYDLVFPTNYGPSIQNKDPQAPINTQLQTPQTPADPVIVYSGTQTQLWSPHLPPLLRPAFDPQGSADSCCVMSVCVKAKNSRITLYWKKKRST